MSKTEKEEQKEKTQEKAESKTKKVSEKDFEKKVLELSKKGLTAEKIGEELRKQNIHPKEYSKKISKILGENYIDPELQNIEKKLERIKTHSKKNKQDKRALREKSRVFSQLRKRKLYLKVPIK